MRSRPMPNAKPEYSSGSIPQPDSTFGCTIPAPSSSIQPSPLQTRQPLALTHKALHINLAGRLGEREVMRTEARLCAFAVELFNECVKRALEIAHCDAPVNDKSLNLMEHR